jgi:DNA repair protein RadA/Sms
MKEGLARCEKCGAWHIGSPDGSKSRVKLRDVKTIERPRIKVGFGNEVLGGGYRIGDSVMIGGKPGTGKSTLALEWAKSFDSCLYICGEEPEDQVRERASRIDESLLDSVEVINAMGGMSIDEALSGTPLQFTVIDSLPGLVGFGAASDADAIALLKAVKIHISTHKTCALVIDHATKTDEFAGLLTFQHEVDATLSLEEGSNMTERILRSFKNRSGPPTTERGILGARGFSSAKG